MNFDKEMQKALESDGEKLRQLTGEDHGPIFPCPCEHPSFCEKYGACWEKWAKNRHFEHLDEKKC